MNKNKLDVVIECVNPEDSSVVIVREYDADSKYVIESIIDECTQKEAYETYNVLGDISQGIISLYCDNAEEDFDYAAYSGTSLSDEDDDDY